MDIQKIEKIEEWWAVPRHTGSVYTHVLSRLHAELKPKTYLEIGTESGATLALADCASIAIDPNFRINRTITGKKSACLLFQMTSDEFFKTQNANSLLGSPIDLAFLDGMHLYEFLLRDFLNIEKVCRPNSVVLIHDCIPTDAHVARRIRSNNSLSPHAENPDWWAGDVWKAISILRKYRPDLRVRAFDAPPTGLLAITNLRPENDLLEANYDNYIEEFRSKSLMGSGYQEYIGSIDLGSTSKLDTQEFIAEMFWI